MHSQQDIIGQFTDLAGIAIERTRADEALRRTASELRESENRFALAVAGANDGIWDRDLDSDRAFFSPRAQELLGWQPDGVNVRSFAEWERCFRFHSDDYVHRQAAIRAHLEGHSSHYEGEWRVLAPDGRYRWVRSRGLCTRDPTGRALRFAGSVSDIDAQKELERQLRQSQRLEAMGTLAGGIAHDFNNILGAILGYGEMALRAAPPGSRLRRDLDSIMIAGERGRALVERILAFSRSGVGERVAVHVEQVVREALELLAAQLVEGVTVKAQLRAGRAAMQGDPTQVHQVVMNLATNAVQAMGAGGTVSVSVDMVRLDTTWAATTATIPPGAYIVLAVTDGGSGIPGAIIDRIFDPFFTTKEIGVGSGLGLSLVHGIVTEVGGAIDVNSTPGVGSVFTVYLPYAGDAADDDADDAPAVPRGNRERVLVVDDEEALVTLAIETLADLGYAPVGFTSSVAALDAFRAAPPLRCHHHRRTHARHVRRDLDLRGARHPSRHPDRARQRLPCRDGRSASGKHRRRCGTEEAAFRLRARHQSGPRVAPATPRRPLTHRRRGATCVRRARRDGIVVGRPLQRFPVGRRQAVAAGQGCCAGRRAAGQYLHRAHRLLRDGTGLSRHSDPGCHRGLQRGQNARRTCVERAELRPCDPDDERVARSVARN